MHPGDAALSTRVISTRMGRALRREYAEMSSSVSSSGPDPPLDAPDVLLAVEPLSESDVELKRKAQEVATRFGALVMVDEREPSNTVPSHAVGAHNQVAFDSPIGCSSGSFGTRGGSVRGSAVSDSRGTTRSGLVERRSIAQGQGSCSVSARGRTDLGPYSDRAGYRVVQVDAAAIRETAFSTEEKAERYVEICARA